MKFMIYLGASVGGVVGGYIPVWLWHAGTFSLWSVIGGIVGTVIGIWAGYKFSDSMET
jgi:hypothetical protein